MIQTPRVHQASQKFLQNYLTDYNDLSTHHRLFINFLNSERDNGSLKKYYKRTISSTLFLEQSRVGQLVKYKEIPDGLRHTLNESSSIIQDNTRKLHYDNAEKLSYQVIFFYIKSQSK